MLFPCIASCGRRSAPCNSGDLRTLHSPPFARNVRPNRHVFVSEPLRRKSVACLMFVVAALAVAQANAPQPAVYIIVARMMAAIQEKARSKSVTLGRDYQLFDKKWDSKEQIEVRLTYEPPDRRRYRIERSRGGEGARIRRAMLNRESDLPI